MNKEKIILIGGGGHCRSCIDVIEQEERYEIVGILDVAGKVGEKVLDYEIIGTDIDIYKYSKKYKNFLVTVGHLKSAEARIRIFLQIKSLGLSIPIIKSPISYVSRHSIIKEGTIIMHGAIINAGVKIGANCIINSNALIEHDAIIEDHCHISTASVINGGVNVGERTFYGSGAISKQYISIPSDSFIKANSIVK
jgi:sugar O-acyltransferase (sialic acid O-acetyltransferase NeuD family)